MDSTVINFARGHHRLVDGVRRPASGTTNLNGSREIKFFAFISSFCIDSSRGLRAVVIRYNGSLKHWHRQPECKYDLVATATNVLVITAILILTVLLRFLIYVFGQASQNHLLSRESMFFISQYRKNLEIP